MKPDERKLLADLASLVGIAGWVSPWCVSENYDHPIHQRRLEWFAKKWTRQGYWDPLMSLSGSFTDAGWEWLASLGIERWSPIDPEHWFYARWLGNPDTPHVPDRNGYYCCLPPEWSHRMTESPPLTGTTT